MAEITRFGSNNVIGHLARSRDAIVTIQAASLHLEMIHPGNRGPEIGTVAILTNIAGLDMIHWGRGGYDESAPLVTGGAFPRRTLETSTHVAGLAVRT